jgi:2-dehydro-3-deoxyglucarate aldolase/4-hydroxy-2-oxoheptanedioate aldolase
VSGKNSLRQRIKSGETVYGQLLLELFTPGVPQILKNCGLDFVLFDMEHGRCELALIAEMIVYAKSAGITPLVRVPDIEFRPLSRVLDLGASGVMVPRVETAQQTQHIVSQLKYAPAGGRGVALGVAHDNYRAAGPTYFESANQDTIVIALLETTKAFENLDAILSTPGLDVAWMGHYDLTVSMGIPAQFENPRFLEMMDRLLSGCSRHGVAPGFLPGNPADTKHWVGKGFRVISLCTDIGVYQNALQSFHGAVKTDSAPPS